MSIQIYTSFKDKLSQKYLSEVDDSLEIMRQLPDSFIGSAFNDFARDSKTGHLLLAGNDNTVVGFLLWDLAGTSDDIAEIKWLAVTKDLHRVGIGRLLLQSSEQQAATNGYTTMEVKTLADGVDSEEYDVTRKFYERQGYALKEVIDNYPGWEPGNPCAIYRKAIP